MVQSTQCKPKIRSVRYNVAMNLILTTSSFVFPLITTPYVARILSPEGLGMVAWAVSFASYFSVIAGLGFSLYGQRECAKIRDNSRLLNRTMVELALLQICAMTMALALYVAAVALVPQARENIWISLIFGVNIMLTSCGYEWFYQSIEQYGYITARSILCKLVSLILMFALVRHANDAVQYAIVLCTGTVGTNIFNIARLHKYVSFQNLSGFNCVRHLRPMVWYSINRMASGMRSNADMLVCGFFLPDALVGCYSIVLKVRSFSFAAVDSVGGVMLPRFSYHEGHGERRKTLDLLAKNFNLLIMMALAAGVMLTVCANPIILFLGGADYLAGRPALIVTAWVPLLSASAATLTNYLVSTNRDKTAATLNVVGLVVQIVFALILIPTFGILGAAVSVLLYETVSLSMRLVVLRKELRVILAWLDPWKSVISAGLAMCCGLFIDGYLGGCHYLLEIVIDGAVIAAVYGMSLVIMRERFVMGLLRTVSTRLRRQVTAARFIFRKEESRPHDFADTTSRELALEEEKVDQAY
ncbi:flippase [Bifidobacterium choloepi]|uniref:Flippase n=1 Tax=Bifidobacterium choloepi TaxID=2614131 RepID=A0A6I5NJ07_9BIFI|nr:flippase [Bifidobacterium choloepi]NEG70363.1 flippase [Bifidobacterium choloepi]